MVFIPGLSLLLEHSCGYVKPKLWNVESNMGNSSLCHTSVQQVLKNLSFITSQIAQVTQQPFEYQVTKYLTHIFFN